MPAAYRGERHRAHALRHGYYQMSLESYQLDKLTIHKPCVASQNAVRYSGGLLSFTFVISCYCAWATIGTSLVAICYDCSQPQILNDLPRPAHLHNRVQPLISSNGLRRGATPDFSYSPEYFFFFYFSLRSGKFSMNLFSDDSINKIAVCKNIKG